MLNGLPIYNINDHYWKVANTPGYWSSKTRTYVKSIPETFKGIVTPVPSEVDIPNGPKFVPDSVYLWQAKAILSQAGLLSSADAAISNSGNSVLIQAWEYAPFISRNSPAVAAIGALLNLTSEQVDQLFRDANAIKV